MMEKAGVRIELLNRKTLKDDIEMLYRLESRVFGVDSYPRYFFRQSVEILGDTFLVCRDNKKNIIGYILGAIKLETNEAWLLSMCVDEQFRKRGIGSALFKAFFDALKQKLVQQVFATVDPRNKEALNLYLKHGFKIQKMEQDYHGWGYHRYLMKKILV